MIYIQRRGDGYLETVDELNSGEYKEARRLVNEYRISDPYGSYYTSSRACRDWNKK